MNTPIATVCEPYTEVHGDCLYVALSLKPRKPAEGCFLRPDLVHATLGSSTVVESLPRTAHLQAHGSTQRKTRTPPCLSHACRACRICVLTDRLQAVIARHTSEDGLFHFTLVPPPWPRSRNFGLCDRGLALHAACLAVFADWCSEERQWLFWQKVREPHVSWV